MIAKILARLSPEHKSRLRSWERKFRQKMIQKFRSYGKAELIQALRSLGIERGNTVMMHSSFSAESGFVGSPTECIDALMEVVGPEGHVLMVSMPYQSSTYEYLQQGKLFDVRKSLSHMGMLSETFRRRPGVRRSHHPTHPVLAAGPRAAWLVAHHERCLSPCGLGTPFEKLLQLNGKVLFFNVSFFTFTFFHFLEERIEDRLGFQLFFPEPFEVPYIDSAGQPQTMQTRVYSLEANGRRRPQILKDAFDRQGLIQVRRVGNSHLQLISTVEAVRCFDAMTARGVYCYA